MTTQTLTLADFLLARIAEDEAVARAATPGPWWWNPKAEPGGWGDGGPNLETVGRGPVYQDGSQGAAGYVVGAYGYDAWGITVSDEDAAHIARWDPARVLAECQAKRRIVAMHEPYETEVLTADDEENVTLCRLCGFDFPCDTLRALAMPYAAHPDYRDEWRP